MYGLVLMTALATGSGSPSYGDGIGCFGGGCYSAGCCGGVVITGGCYGSCSGCYSSACYGSCTGCRGSLFPLFPRARAVLAGFLGFHSSCCGHVSSCYGSSACYGSANYYSPSYGSSFGPVLGCSGCTGCTGCGGGGIIIYGSAPYSGDAVTHLSIPAAPREFEAARIKPNAAPARLTIEVPDDAKLYVDGQLTKGEGSSRNFHTPDLPNGQSYFYELKAVVTVDGRPVTETKKVIVRAGDTLSESFPKLISAAKASKDSVVASQSR